MSKKILKSIKSGDLVKHEKVLKSFSQKEMDEISKRMRFIKTAIELRKLRKGLRISQLDLARKMRVKREFISRIESGKQNITLETLYRIAEVTGKEVQLTFR